MKLIINHMPGDLNIKESTEIFGTVAGTVTVAPGGILHLFGSIGGDLVVEDGAAFIYGTVHGDVRNLGGTLEISGTVDGALVRSGGDTTIISCAQIAEIR